jgi:hypothetical protein
LSPLVKTEVIVGENTAELLLETDIALFNPALKVRNVTGEILDITTHILPGTVLVQGLVKHHLFYVGTDMVVHHQAVEVPFCTCIQIPGAEPSMQVSVHECIENILPDLATDGNVVGLKTVLGLLAKVTEVRQLKLERGEGPSYLFPGIHGESTIEEVNESTIILAQPALKVTEIKTQVVIPTAEVIADKVIAKGYLSEDIFTVGLEDNIEHHQKEELPFSTLVELPGVCAGMQAQISAQVDEIKYELTVQGTELKQKIIYVLTVKVCQDLEIPLAVGNTLVRAQRIVGTQALQKLLQHNMVLVPAAQKVNQVSGEVTNLQTDVIAGKVIVQGVFAARIYFTGDDGINCETQEHLPFVGYVALEGAQPGMTAQVTPSVTGIITEFDVGDNLLHIKVLLKLSVKALQWVQAAVAEQD